MLRLQLQNFDFKGLERGLGTDIFIALPGNSKVQLESNHCFRSRGFGVSFPGSWWASQDLRWASGDLRWVSWDQVSSLVKFVAPAWQVRHLFRPQRPLWFIRWRRWLRVFLQWACGYLWGSMDFPLLKKSEAGSKLSDLLQCPHWAAHSAEGAPGRLVRTPGCSGGEYLTSTLPPAPGTPDSWTRPKVFLTTDWFQIQVNFLTPCEQQIRHWFSKLNDNAAFDKSIQS